MNHLADGTTVLAAASVERGMVIDLVVILATSAIVAMIMQRLRLAVIPAYLLAGALVGPRALGLVPAPEALGAVSHLAIILLLFSIGLELHVSVLKHRFLQIALAGSTSCLLCSLVGWPVGMAFGLSGSAALAVAMALTLSSTAVVLRILAQRREMHRMSSRLALATLVIQDMLVLAMLAALPVIAQWAGKGAVEPIILEAPPADRTGWPATVLDGVVRLAGIAVLAILGRLVLPRVLRESLRGRSTEVMMVAGVAVALASAVAAEALGFSLEMGAFLGGFILAGTSVRYQLSAQIAPLRDVFLAVFFTTVGMRLDPQVVMQYWWAILLGLTVMIALKTLAISGACWTFGASASIALAVGVALSQGGEFSLILLNQAHAFGLLNEKTTAIAIAVIVMSLILTPGLIAFGRRLASAASGLRAAPWIGGSEMKDGAPGKSEEDGSRRHWIIAGYGPIGQSVAQKLDQTGIPYVVIELNPKTVDEQSRMGKSFIFGDVANPDVLISAGVNEAGGLVLTIPDEEAVLRACAIGRTHVPDLYILARLHSLSRAPEAVRLGTSEVTIDESQTAEGILKAVTNRVEGGASSGAAKPDPVPVER